MAHTREGEMLKEDLDDGAVIDWDSLSRNPSTRSLSLVPLIDVILLLRVHSRLSPRVLARRVVHPCCIHRSDEITPSTRPPTPPTCPIVLLATHISLPPSPPFLIPPLLYLSDLSYPLQEVGQHILSRRPNIDDWIREELEQPIEEIREVGDEFEFGDRVEDDEP